MDLLGSILENMEKPPCQSNKKQIDEAKKRQEREKEKLRMFRSRVEAKVNDFIKNDEIERLKFDPMEKVQRTIIHDVADVAGLLSYSFGEEGFDRHVYLFKKEHPPSERELAALRKGVEFNPEEHEELKFEPPVPETLKELPSIPKSNYKDKYKHLLGEDAAIDAAKVTTANSKYGFVPSQNKKDQRSIEQTLADIQAKKKLKTTHDGI